MGDGRHVGELQIDQDLDFQRREWRVQRLGWWVMGLVLVLALGGAFGRGPLAHATLGTPGGPLRVEYDRLARHGAKSELRLHLGPAAVSDGVARVWLDREWVDGADVEDIQPVPERVIVAGDRLVYEFQVGSATAASVIRFALRPDAMWRRELRVGLTDGPTLAATQFVYP
ncbi:MAG TPA: hypothetical protein VHQ45_13460 [Gemmatimonadaceae bacterium]|jgi:hypothetical protein|nr:hypothetical protein [Gemmatimonadaceae bacterium]